MYISRWPIVLAFPEGLAIPEGLAGNYYVFRNGRGESANRVYYTLTSFETESLSVSHVVLLILGSEHATSPMVDHNAYTTQ